MLRRNGRNDSGNDSMSPSGKYDSSTKQHGFVDVWLGLVEPGYSCSHIFDFSFDDLIKYKYSSRYNCTERLSRLLKV